MNLRKMLFVAVWLVCLVSVSSAYDFSGTSTGVFTDPQGPGGMTVTGVGTNHFTWGEGYPPPSCYLDFTGTTFSGTFGSEFSIGTLAYFNGTIVSGTEATSVNLKNTLTFTDPTGVSKDFNFTFTLNNTLNTGIPAEDADYVYLDQLYDPSAYFTDGGVDYYLQFTRFGTMDQYGFITTANEFHVLEGGTASATIFAKLTSTPVNTVPEPSVIWLIGAGILGIGSLRKKLAE